MPRLTVCNARHCPELTPGRWCPTHEPAPFATSTRRTTLPPDWPTIRLPILERDGYRCTHIDANGNRCTAPATDVHHIGDRNDHSDTNLASLCAPHHATETGREGNAARVNTSRGGG